MGLSSVIAFLKRNDLAIRYSDFVGNLIIFDPKLGRRKEKRTILAYDDIQVTYVGEEIEMVELAQADMVNKNLGSISQSAIQEWLIKYMEG